MNASNNTDLIAMTTSWEDAPQDLLAGVDEASPGEEDSRLAPAPVVVGGSEGPSRTLEGTCSLMDPQLRL